MPEQAFRLEVPTGGSFSLSTIGPKEQIYLLTFEKTPDNRVTLPFIETYILALDLIEHRMSHKGVLVTTSGIQKFFSNGFDLQHSLSEPTFFDRFFVLLRKILTFPMPTVAFINGHAFGAGFILPGAHDYRLQHPSKGFVCLPELDLGVLLPAPVNSLFKEKLTPAAYRMAVLEARRFGGPAALEAGLVDGLAKTLDDVVAFIGSRPMLGKGGANLRGMKEDAWKETVLSIDEHEVRNLAWRREIGERNERVAGEGKKRVEEWEKVNGTFKGKL